MVTLGTGCAMYGAPPQKLARVPPIKPAKELPKDDAVVAKKYNEEPCAIPRSSTAPPASKTKTRSAEITAEGDAKVQLFDHTTDGKAKGQLLIDSVETYSRALSVDPFSAEATAKLARVYDKALRKSCALAVLDRLGKLAANPKFARAANAEIDNLIDTKGSFEGYRNDALRVLGR